MPREVQLPCATFVKPQAASEGPLGVNFFDNQIELIYEFNLEKPG